MKPMKESTKTKVFGGLKFELEQIYWSEKWAQADAADSRKHGWYCRIVPVMHNGEIKYARYIREIKMTRVPLSKQRRKKRGK